MVALVMQELCPVRFKSNATVLEESTRSKVPGWLAKGVAQPMGTGTPGFV